MISSLIISAISIISVTTLNQQSAIQDQEIQDFSAAMSRQLAGALREPLFTDDSLTMQLMVNNFAQLPRAIDATILNNKQQLITQSELAKLTPDNAQQLINGYQQQRSNHRNSSQSIIQTVTPIEFHNKVGGYVITQLKTNLLSSTYTNILRVMLWVSVSVILGSLVAAYFISRHISNPIRQMLEATRQLSQGTFKPITERRNDELGHLITTINQMGDGLLRKQQVESMLDRFLAKDVAEQLLKQLDTVEVRGERVNATVLFADIVGFTTMSEQLSPEKVAELLNEYFSYFTACAHRYFGTIDKFIGDCAMVVFGTPKEDDEHQFHAIACAVLMQKLTARINQQRDDQGLPKIQLSIGINSGPMLAGILGDQKRMEYTVVGDSVNLASRLCAEASAGSILATYDTCELSLIAGSIRANKHKNIRVRGKEKHVPTFLVTDVAPEHLLSMDSLIDDILNKNLYSTP